MTEDSALNSGLEVEQYELRLFIAGNSPISARAINNLKAILEERLKGHYNLEIIDIHQQPKLVKEENITAVPTLIRKTPLPRRMLIGDMSDQERVLRGLAL